MHPPHFTHPQFGFRMIRVEGGSFEMGSKDGYIDERPVHKVELSIFYLAEFPVTQALWLAVIGKGRNNSFFKGSKRPVERVSWYDAVVFCNALNAQSRDERGHALPVRYFADSGLQHSYGHTKGGWELPNEGEVFCRWETKGYRLPTEAEWEYAARAGKTQANLYAGGNKLSELGWCKRNSYRETKPVGLKLANELGLYDMSGNVWEWCWDWYDDYNTESCIGPIGPTRAISRVCRGGSWSSNMKSCRAVFRYWDKPVYRLSNLGFRLCFVPSP